MLLPRLPACLFVCLSISPCRGRGKKITQWHGNVKLAEIVKAHQHSYGLEAVKFKKALLNGLIMKDIRAKSRGKVGFAKQDPATKRWYSVTDEKARHTIAQVFRDANNGEYRSSRQQRLQRHWVNRSHELATQQEQERLAAAATPRVQYLPYDPNAFPNTSTSSSNYESNYENQQENASAPPEAAASAAAAHFTDQKDPTRMDSNNHTNNHQQQQQPLPPLICVIEYPVDYSNSNTATSYQQASADIPHYNHHDSPIDDPPSSAEYMPVHNESTNTTSSASGSEPVDENEAEPSTDESHPPPPPPAAAAMPPRYIVYTSGSALPSQLAGISSPSLPFLTPDPNSPGKYLMDFKAAQNTFVSKKNAIEKVRVLQMLCEDIMFISGISNSGSGSNNHPDSSSLQQRWEKGLIKLSNRNDKRPYFSKSIYPFFNCFYDCFEQDEVRYAHAYSDHSGNFFAAKLNERTREICPTCRNKGRKYIFDVVKAKQANSKRRRK